jgi:phenylalanine-4-hydroxylase
LALGNMSDVLNANSIPKFTKLNEWFQSMTRWEIVRVTGLIPVDEFFNFLAQKKFCSSTLLREME